MVFLRSVSLVAFTLPLLAQCPGPEPVAATIPQVQGAALRSPCTGLVVTVTGVVTASYAPLNGFFLQDVSGDGNPATSDGIFVFQGNANALPERASIARVTGRVAEFARSGTAGSVTEIDVRPTATPQAAVEIVGRGTVPNPLDLDPVPGTELESREGMLAAYPAAAVVEPSNTFGEFYALRYDRVPAFVRPTRDEPGSGTPMLITRGIGRIQAAKSYDLVPPLTGVVHFDFGSFRFEPAEAYALSDAGWTATGAPASTELRIASLNALRLVASLNAEELETKLGKLGQAIRDQLRSPDIIGVQEVESLALLERVAGRAGNYSAVLLPSCDPGRISSGLLYNPARVRKIAERQLQAEAPQFRNGRCALADGRVFQQYLFDRPPLAVEIEADGQRLTVIVNHWRSQLGGNEPERQAASDFLATELRTYPPEGLIVLGDFNDNEGSRPVLSLAEGSGLVNLAWRTPAWLRYSLIFEGRSDAFDHILVSPRLAEQTTASGFAHYNADFPESLGNNRDTSLRTSDHDNPWAHIRVAGQ